MCLEDKFTKNGNLLRPHEDRIRKAQTAAIQHKGATLKELAGDGDLDRRAQDLAFDNLIIGRELRSFSCNKCGIQCCIDCKMKIAKHDRAALQTMQGTLTVMIKCPGCRDVTKHPMNPAAYGFYKNCILKTPTEMERTEWVMKYVGASGLLSR